VLGRGPRGGRRVYLTFDDGPSPSATPLILETLARFDVPAAFFQVGRYVALFPNLAREAHAAGHEIGNHTADHRKLHCLGPGAVREQIARCQRMIIQAVGIAPRFFRAPHGLRNPWVGVAAGRLGCRTVGWTFGVWDTDRPGEEVIAARVLKRLVPGAIILLHDGDGYDPRGDRAQTAQALEAIIRGARERGYEFGALAELIGEREVAAA
jgi:peptidoglycan/xylan/chitin deacetylase (PgdA/CDA1 family)